jgi:hypothetical protein
VRKTRLGYTMTRGNTVVVTGKLIDIATYLEAHHDEYPISSGHQAELRAAPQLGAAVLPTHKGRPGA